MTRMRINSSDDESADEPDAIIESDAEAEAEAETDIGVSRVPVVRARSRYIDAEAVDSGDDGSEHECDGVDGDDQEANVRNLIDDCHVNTDDDGGVSRNRRLDVQRETDETVVLETEQDALAHLRSILHLDGRGGHDGGAMDHYVSPSRVVRRRASPQCASNARPVIIDMHDGEDVVVESNSDDDAVMGTPDNENGHCPAGIGGSDDDDVYSDRDDSAVNGVDPMQDDEFDLGPRDDVGKFALQNVVDLYHSDLCYQLNGGATNPSMPSGFSARRFVGADVQQLCFPCQLMVCVRAERHVRSAADASHLECVLSIGPNRAVLHSAMAHTWSIDHDKGEANDQFTIRIAKCVHYGFAERMIDTQEGRAFAHKVRTSVHGANADEQSFAFCTGWLQLLYTEVVDRFNAASDADDVVVLGRRLPKDVAVGDSTWTRPPVNGDTDWPVKYLLQTIVTSLHNGCESRKNTFDVDVVRFVVQPLNQQ